MIPQKRHPLWCPFISSIYTSRLNLFQFLNETRTLVNYFISHSYLSKLKPTIYFQIVLLEQNMLLSMHHQEHTFFNKNVEEFDIDEMEFIFIKAAVGNQES